MFDLYENIKSLCEAKGVSVSKMCVDIGVSKSLMSNIKNHRADTLSAKSVAKIADYLGVSYDCVMHGQKEKPATKNGDGQVPIDFVSIVSTYSKLSDSARAELDRYAQYLLSQQGGK